MAHRPLVGIVLAGGASRRFGSDKLAAPLAGRPLVVHAIEALRRVPVAEIVVVGPPEPATPGWLADVAAAGARLVRDRERFGGPLAGLAEGLRALGSDEIALVVGGDMPWLDPGVLAGLAAALDERDEAGIGCLVTEGRDQLLPLALRPGPALALAAPLLDAGERRLGALVRADGLRVRVAADPSTVRDVDTAGDMEPAGADEAPAGGREGRISGPGTDSPRGGG